MYDSFSLRRDIQTLFDFIKDTDARVAELEDRVGPDSKTIRQDPITEEALVSLSEELEAIRESQRRIPHIEGFYLFDEVSTADDNENGPILDLRALEGFDSLVEYVLNEHANNTDNPIPVGGVRVSKHFTKLQAETNSSQDEDEVQKKLDEARDILQSISEVLDCDYDDELDEIEEIDYILRKARRNSIF